MDNVGGYILFDGRDFNRADEDHPHYMKIPGIWDYFNNNLGKKPIFIKYPLIFDGEESVVMLREVDLRGGIISFSNDTNIQEGEESVGIIVFKNDIIEMHEL